METEQNNNKINEHNNMTEDLNTVNFDNDDDGYTLHSSNHRLDTNADANGVSGIIASEAIIPPNDGVSEIISSEETIPPNDYDNWLQRYYQLVEKKPRYKKYEKIVVEVLEAEKNDMRPIYNDNGICIGDPYEILNELNFELVLWELNTVWARGKTSNGINCAFCVVCPECNTRNIARDGYRDDENKFKCKNERCGRKYFYYNGLVNRRYNERRFQIAMPLIEKECSHNFVMELLQISSKTLSEWISYVKGSETISDFYSFVMSNGNTENDENETIT